MPSTLLLLQAFSDGILKLSSLASPSKAELKAESHFGVDEKNWRAFEKSLRGKEFQQAVLKHPDADSKLRKYVRNFGGYLRSKDTVGTVPSRSSGKVYQLKKLPSGRIGCGCKDWQYVHSVKGTDCDHIRVARAMKTKVSSLYQAARGAGQMHKFHKSQTELKKGKLMQENVLRLRQGMPLLPVK
jgi:hypothetical protein